MSSSFNYDYIIKVWKKKSPKRHDTVALENTLLSCHSQPSLFLRRLSLSLSLSNVVLFSLNLNLNLSMFTSTLSSETPVRKQPRCPFACMFANTSAHISHTPHFPRCRQGKWMGAHGSSAIRALDNSTTCFTVDLPPMEGSECSGQEGCLSNSHQHLPPFVTLSS